MIQQLTENLNQQQQKIDTAAYNSGQSSNAAGLTGPTHSTSLAAVKSQESQQLESSPSATEIPMSGSVGATTGNGVHGQAQASYL